MSSTATKGSPVSLFSYHVLRPCNYQLDDPWLQSNWQYVRVEWKLILSKMYRRFGRFWVFEPRHGMGVCFPEHGVTRWPLKHESCPPSPPNQCPYGAWFYRTLLQGIYWFSLTYARYRDLLINHRSIMYISHSGIRKREIFGIRTNQIR